ncbi:hypothetical protein ACOCEA_15995 [Maribacter sp. CXY002]|uniref:hypothetical protein n=1 Tax=Maribacter luteocoastalis TaxID=3407671 RepID=UPI003B677432
MKKYVLFASCLMLFSCNDGDLQIETLDFDSIKTIKSCSAISVSSANVLFKINNDEALIIELPNGVIKNEATIEDIISQVPAAAKITYRIFSDNVTESYFCDDVPPVTPIVTEEITAEDGQVFITTVEIDANTYEHTIRLSGISLVTGNDNRITDLQINEFGTVTTSL